MAPETLGDRLRAAKKQRGVKNDALARAAGVHLNTVSKWLSDAQVPDEKALAAIAPLLDTSVAWLRYGDSPPVAPGARRVSEPRRVFISYQLSDSARVKLYELLAGIARDFRASEDEMNWAKDLLTREDNYTYSVGGSRREYSEEELLEDMDGVAEGIRIILKKRRERQRQHT